MWFRYSLIFIIGFFYIYPIFPAFLPIPLDRVLQIIGVGVLLGPWNRKEVFLNNGVYFRVFFSNILVVLLAFVAQLQNLGGFDSYFLKQTFDIYFYFFAAYLVNILLYNRYKLQFNLTRMVDFVVILFVIQAVVSFVFFMQPSLYESYAGILKAETNAGILDRLGLINKRLMGVGSSFFSGVVKYGFGFLLLIYTLKDPVSIFHRNKFLFVTSFILIISAGVLTGRTFFIAIALGLGLYMVQDRRNFFAVIYKVLPLLVLGVGLGMVVLNFFLPENRMEIIFNFVFEMFINYADSGELSTSSSDKTLQMFVFPDDLNTWLFGDGKMLLGDGSYYQRIDVGFIRLIYYFGLPSTIFYFLVKAYLFDILRRLAANRFQKQLFVFMFFWFFLYHIKGLANTDEFIVLFLIALVGQRSIHGREQTLSKHSC